MTASKSSRAGNARSGQGGTARNGSAARSGSAAGNGSTARNGSAARGGAARGGAARNANAARAGTAVKDGNAAKNGSTGRAGIAAKGGPAVRTNGAARKGTTAGTARARALQDDFGTSIAGTGPALWFQLTTLVLALAGLGVSIYLTIAHFTESALLGCSESGLVNCTKVTTSAQSYVFGIPVAVLGLAFFLFAVAIMSPWAWRATRREIHLVRVASLVVGIGFVLYLLYAELFIIGSICLYCTSVHVITFLLFVLTMGAVAAWGLRPGAPWTLRLGRPGKGTEAEAIA